MPRRGENIYKRKDGRWEGRYIKGRSDGKAQYGYVFARTYNEVKHKLNAAKEVIQNLSESSPAQTQDSDEIFSEVAWKWLESQCPQLKQSSIVKYTNILNLYLLPAFAEKEIAEISRDEVSAFGNMLLTFGGKDKNGLSPKTVNSVLSVMKNIFDYAEQVKGLTVANIKNVSVKQPQRNLRIFSRAEQQRLNEYLCDNLDFCNLGILVCLYTGLRIGEICALKWGDISFDEQYIYVHQSMQRIQTLSEAKAKTEVIVAPPKSDCSIRKVPIPDNVFKLLETCQKNKDVYLLSGSSIGYIEPRTMQYRFQQVIKQCKIDDANFHTLRHTFATRCVELGFDIKSLSEILGHASVNITLNRYVHPSMELKQKNMNMLSQLFAVK